jgi:hypothetical protein
MNMRSIRTEEIRREGSVWRRETCVRRKSEAAGESQIKIKSKSLDERNSRMGGIDEVQRKIPGGPEENPGNYEVFLRVLVRHVADQKRGSEHLGELGMKDRKQSLRRNLVNLGYLARHCRRTGLIRGREIR